MKQNGSYKIELAEIVMLAIVLMLAWLITWLVYRFGPKDEE